MLFRGAWSIEKGGSPCSFGRYGAHHFEAAHSIRLAPTAVAGNGDGHWRASEQLLPRGTFPAAAMQAGTLERLARPALVACCKRLGVWTTGKAVAQMKEALGGAFELALAQHREAQQRGAAGAAALERLAAAAQATRDG